MRFKNRDEAARYLAKRLAPYRGKKPLVLAIPRGAAVMARIIADKLEGDMDVVLVRKLRAPHQPELAVGSIDEAGEVSLSDYAPYVDATKEYLQREQAEQLEVLRQRRQAYTQARPPIDPHGRVVIVVDDGIATGATMIAALKSVRAKKPATLIAATAVAPPENVARIHTYADDVVCLATPPDFYAVGQFFDEFEPVSDEEVVELLKSQQPALLAADPGVTIRADGVTLHGDLTLPKHAQGIVVFAHGSGSSRLSPRNRYVAEVLQHHGLGTLLFDLLTPDEDCVYANRFDVKLLGRRLVTATAWLGGRPDTKGLPVCYFGASTGAAAALIAAAELGSEIACVVSRGGRPDLAMDALKRVSAPTLFIVGERDAIVLELNRKAYDALSGIRELSVVPGATHLFEEPGALEDAARRAADWFCDHLSSPKIVASLRATGGDTHVRFAR
jgi:predicted phosphoribosyltransferase/predicted alpha/beta-hydrolase family hydrolase